MCIGGVNKVAARGVQNTLRGTGRTRCIENEERIFRVHLFGFAISRGFGHGVIPPDVFTVVPVAFNLVADAFHHDDFFDRGAFFNSRVRVGFLGNSLGAAEGAIAGDQNFRSGVFDTISERLGAEAAEYYAMNGADTCAGQKTDRQFGDHRKEETDTIAFFNSVVLEYVGELANLLVQLLVGKSSFFAGLIAFPDQADLIAALFQMTVQAVVRNIKLAAFKELHINGAFFDVKVIIHHLVPFFEPGDLLLGDFRPEFIRLLNRTFPQLVVSLPAADPGFFSGRFRNRIYFL